MENLTNPIFLLGTQRSGTTLLTRILSSHPKLYIQNELPMDGMFAGELSKASLLTRITSTIEDMHSVSLSSEHGTEPIWGWKDPLLTYHLESLKQHFPKSKYILIVRDPRAVVNSYMDNKWGLGTNAYTGALRWEHEVQLQLEFAKEMGNNCLTIKYEDLVQDLPLELKKLCQFIEIEYSEKMLDFHKKKLEFTVNRENVNTAKPADPRNVNKWQGLLSAREVALIEMVAEKQMNVCDYNLTAKPISPSWIELTYYKLHQAIVGEIQLQYKWKYRDKLKNLGLIK